jgi:hypothetical protein
LDSLLVFFHEYSSLNGTRAERVAEELPEIYRGHSEEELTLEFKRISR